MDTPQVGALELADAMSRLTDGADAVLGLARDGGWWALGLRTPQGGVFAGIPTSVGDTGERQLRRLVGLGLSVSLLATHRDVDRWPDALAAARAWPHGAFAATVRAVARISPATAVESVRASGSVPAA
jgi:hypothetical protein